MRPPSSAHVSREPRDYNSQDAARGTLPARRLAVQTHQNPNAKSPPPRRARRLRAGIRELVMTSLTSMVLSTEKAPRAIGPYSQGILINRTLYVSGQVGRDPISGKLVSGGLAEEFKQALVNVGEILKAGGCDFSNVVKSTVLLADINDFNLFNDVYMQFFKGSFPARAAYQVASLPLGAHMEIEVIAVQGPLTCV